MPNNLTNPLIATTSIFPLRPSIKKPIIPNSLTPAGSAFIKSIIPPIPKATALNTNENKSNNLPTPIIACLITFTKVVPTIAAKPLIACEFCSITLLTTTNAFFTKSKNPDWFVSNLNLNNLSPNIDKVPVKVVANTSVALENLPFSPNNSSNLFTVSSIVTVAPALNPNKALTPLSLNKSAAPIPAPNDLCICSAVVLKSNPVTAATLPVIFNIFCRWSASLETTARFAEPAAISSSEKGTLAAKSIKPLNAFLPCSTLPNKKLNLNPNSSTSLPTLIIERITRPPPIPISADWTENIDALKLVRPALIPLNAALVLSLANIFKTKFCAIIYALLLSFLLLDPLARLVKILSNGYTPIFPFVKQTLRVFLTYRQQ